MKRILITGATGFIGSYIADSFLKKNYSLILLSHSRVIERPQNDLIVSYQIDLNDHAAVYACLKNERPDVICHLASSNPYVQESLHQPHLLFHDLVATAHLFESAVESGASQIIFSSSAGVYSPTTKQPIDERTPTAPLSPLGIMKLATETYCNYIRKTRKVKCVIFRYFNVYGPKQRLGINAGIIPTIVERALKKQPIMVFGDGKQTRDFVFVEDVADANIRAVERGADGLFNVGSGVGTSILTLIKTMERLLKRKIIIEYKDGFIPVKHSVANSNKIKRILKWKASTDLSTGLTKTIDYYKQTFHVS